MARTSEVIYRCEYGEYVLPDGVDVEAYIAEHRERIHAELKERARRIPGAYVEPDKDRVMAGVRDISLDRARQFVRDVVRGIWRQEISDDEIARIARVVEADVAASAARVFAARFKETA